MKNGRYSKEIRYERTIDKVVTLAFGTEGVDSILIGRDIEKVIEDCQKDIIDVRRVIQKMPKNIIIGVVRIIVFGQENVADFRPLSIRASILHVQRMGNTVVVLLYEGMTVVLGMFNIFVV